MSPFHLLRGLAAALFTALMLAAVPAGAATEVNRADRAELESVKGIGPGLAGRIIDARQSGPFKDWDDLVGRVGGIGPATAGKLSEQGLTVAGNSFNAAAAAAAARAAKKPSRADGLK